MLKRFCISFFLVVLVLAFGEHGCLAFEQEDMQVHGFASQGYLYSSGKEFVDGTEDGTWEFNEIGLNMTMPIMDRLRFGMQFFMRDLGDMGNNDLTIDWAYLDYSWRDWLGLRAAKIKIPWGLYNKTRDVDTLRVFIFLPESVYFEGFREFLMSSYGTSLYGTVDAGAAGFFDYEVFAGTTGFNAYEGMKVDDTKMYGGGLFWSTPVSGLKVGGSALSLESNASLLYETGLSAPSADYPGLYEQINVNYEGSGELSLAYVLSMQYEYGNFLFAMEYSETESDFKLSPDNVMYPDVNSNMTVTGWYASVSWRALSWLELGAYYSDVDIDNKAPEYQGIPDYFTYRRDAAFCTRFNINEYMTFKLESHFVNGLADINDALSVSETDKTWEYYAAKIGVTF